MKTGPILPSTALHSHQGQRKPQTQTKYLLKAKFPRPLLITARPNCEPGSPQCYYWHPQELLESWTTGGGAGWQGKAEKQVKSSESSHRQITCFFLLLGGPLPVTLTTAPAPWPLPGVLLILNAARRGRRARCIMVLAILQGPIWAPLQLSPILGLLKED